MHNKRIINDVWWALLREGVPVYKVCANYLSIKDEYVGEDNSLTSPNFLWLTRAEDISKFYTEASSGIDLNGTVDVDKVFEAIHTLGAHWARWSSEHSIHVTDSYLRNQMRECICDMLNERGVPAEISNGGHGISVHHCIVVSYESCFFTMMDYVKYREDVRTGGNEVIRLCRDNMDAIIDAIVAFAERYAALPSKESIDTAQVEPMSGTVASLGKTLDDGFNYRSTCAKCLVTISKGLEANPDDTDLWRLHTMFVNSMKEIAYGTHE